MFTINDGMIEKLAASRQVYHRGLSYFRGGRVVRFNFSEEALCASAIVLGTEEYETGACFSPEGQVIQAQCECPAYYQYGGACKHIVALVKTCQHKFTRATGPNAARRRQHNTLAEGILQHFESSAQAPERIPVNLEVTFEIYYQTIYYKREMVSAISLRMGEDRLYVVKSVRKLLEAIDTGQTLVFGKGFEYSIYNHAFQPQDQPVIELLRELYETENSITESPWNSGAQNGQGTFFKGKQAFLTKSALKKLFSVCASGQLNLSIFGEKYENVEVVEEDLPVTFTVDNKDGNLLLKWEALGLVPLVKTGEYFFYEGKIYHISERQKRCLVPLLIAFNQSSNSIQFTDEQKERFVVDVLPVIKESGRVEISPSLQESLYEPGLEVELYLDREGDAITARVDFLYGEIKFNPFTGRPDSGLQGKTLVRDVETERAVLNLVEQAEFKNLNGKLHLDEDEKIYNFVHQILPRLQEWSNIYYSEGFRGLKVRNAAGFSGGVRLSEDSDMLEFSFQLGDIDMAELGDVFSSLREKKKYHRLKDGSFLPLDASDPSLAQAVDMIDTLNISERDLKKETVHIPKYRALYLDQCINNHDLDVERNQGFNKLIQNITHPRDTDFKVPENFEGVLRDYQTIGFKWLKTLAMYGLGGILADDMGLGKTIQTLAFILSERERVTAPALVVAPTSVVYNWQDEARKFAPELTTVVVAGNPKDREDQLKEARHAHLVITSYSLIRRDAEQYEDINFSYCLLDEAQHIKNPGSLGSRAVKTIKARGYFALTGTPLENSLSELWSIFDFVMRGYLLSRQKFIKKYERPITKDQDRAAMDELQKQIAPFILRRMKKDVLKELPPKTESRMLTDLTQEQKKVYLSYLHRIKGEINAAIAEKGFERSQIKILSALTRLRQICCHPGTFLENYQGDSGKLLSLKEMVQDALAGGHRILLFSQFTSMLAIIRNHLDKEGVSYFYLDGSTKTEERGRLVREFNEGAGDIFLISLKAGGTGLNLTGADMVIHYDPWWNPAVEEQAADRAYRIGQENPVQVINLITRGTIEEKIFELQQKKRAMIDSVIKPGQTMLSRMTEQELREIFKA
ncbi:MAG: helicase [Firmicutes bacterium]|nr:helicase [Bacillota bacterium]